MNQLPDRQSDDVRVYRGAAATSRLAELGLTPKLLGDSVLYMMRIMDEFSPHDPAATIGMSRWGKVLRGLRDRLVPLGWTSATEGGYEFVVHPRNAFAISVSSGDAATGTGEPPNTSPHGPMTQVVVQRSSEGRQVPIPGLVDNLPVQQVPPESKLPKTTYVLLYFIDRKAHEVRVELSLPDKVSVEGRIFEWHEQVILDALPFDGVPESVDTPQFPSHDDQDDNDDFDIPTRAS